MALRPYVPPTALELEQMRAETEDWFYTKADVEALAAWLEEHTRLLPDGRLELVLRDGCREIWRPVRDDRALTLEDDRELMEWRGRWFEPEEIDDGG